MRSGARHLRILGIRGVPAQHGGFETFAAHLAPYLVDRGWDVTVYCQDQGSGPIREDDWNGVRRVHIPVPGEGAAATVRFDWRAVRHAVREPGLALTLGYNTAAFCLLLRLKGIRNVINMDGIEWRRAKWKPWERAWLYANERLGCWIGDHLVADHPEIATHLSTRVDRDKITTLPYGAEAVWDADARPVRELGLSPRRYAIVIARPEPENSLLEIVQAFAARPRDAHLVVLGNYAPERNDYHRRVMAAATRNVLFPGAIYDPAVVRSLRYHASVYVHGHRVGGTNPSLVEALAAGSPVIAHDNPFNRWVAGGGAQYFADAEHCAAQLDLVLDRPELQHAMSQASRARHAALFTWDAVLRGYEALLEKWLARDPAALELGRGSIGAER